MNTKKYKYYIFDNGELYDDYCNYQVFIKTELSFSDLLDRYNTDSEERNKSICAFIDWLIKKKHALDIQTKKDIIVKLPFVDVGSVIDRSGSKLHIYR